MDLEQLRALLTKAERFYQPERDGVFQDSCRVDRVFRPPFSAAVVPAPALG